MVDTQITVYTHRRRSTMARQRRSYTREFKVEAVKLVTEPGYSVAEAARSLDLGETLLRSWKQAFPNEGGQAFRTRQAPGLRRGTPPAPRRQQASAAGARHVKESDGLLRQGSPVIFAFIKQHQEVWPVTLMCDTL